MRRNRKPDRQSLRESPGFGVVVCYVLVSIDDMRLLYRNIPATGGNEPLMFPSVADAKAFAASIGKTDFVDVYGLDTEARNIYLEGASFKSSQSI